jgi:NADH-quinone oxidoreductase subunit C
VTGTVSTTPPTGYDLPVPSDPLEPSPNPSGLTPMQIAALLVDRFGPALTGTFVAEGEKHPRVHLAASAWREVAEFLHRDPRLSMDWLACLGGVDYAAAGQLAVVYDLWSVDHGHRFAVKAFTDRADPHVPTVSDLWPTADWHEREAFDLFGIQFDGHPDLRRILLADDWVGYPLRKDYLFPREYHGIPGTVEPDWHRP